MLRVYVLVVRREEEGYTDNLGLSLDVLISLPYLHFSWEVFLVFIVV